jgi:CubicO group peptidase (beta-lactamase class C family)
VPHLSSTSRRAFLHTVAAGAIAPAIVPLWRLDRGAQTSSRRADGVEKDLASLVKQFSVPGASIAIVENGQLARTMAAGVRKAGDTAAVAGDTVFEAASLSKGPFAYLVLKLAELGRIDLDTPIGDYFRLPDLRDEPRVDRITPRLVLSHQTGLPNWRAAREPMRMSFDPGAGFAYSGEAYVRLQRYVERTMGASLTALSTEREFTPWRMARTSYIWRDDFAAIAADGHDGSGNAVRTRLWGFKSAPAATAAPAGPEPPPVTAIPNAAASLYSTAQDYGRFLERLVAPPAADQFHLGRAPLDAMFKAVSHPNSDLGWGLGWGLATVDGADTFWQWGNNGVYRGFVVGSRARRWGAVVFTNSANGLSLCREVVTRLLGVEHPAFRWNLVMPRTP